MTSTTVEDVANQPKTPMMSVRIPADTQDAVRRIAERHGLTLTDAVRAALIEYVERHGSRDDERPPTRIGE